MLSCAGTSDSSSSSLRGELRVIRPTLQRPHEDDDNQCVFVHALCVFRGLMSHLKDAGCVLHRLSFAAEGRNKHQLQTCPNDVFRSKCTDLCWWNPLLVLDIILVSGQFLPTVEERLVVPDVRSPRTVCPEFIITDASEATTVWLFHLINHLNKSFYFDLKMQLLEKIFCYNNYLTKDSKVI